MPTSPLGCPLAINFHSSSTDADQSSTLAPILGTDLLWFRDLARICGCSVRPVSERPPGL